VKKKYLFEPAKGLLHRLLVGIFLCKARQQENETMNAIQVMGIIVLCTAVFAGVVTWLAAQGVHVLVAVLGVYLLAVWTMLCMQRKARESFDCRDAQFTSHISTPPGASHAYAKDFSSGNNVVSFWQGRNKAY